MIYGLIYIYSPCKYGLSLFKKKLGKYESLWFPFNTKDKPYKSFKQENSEQNQANNYK